MAAARLELAEGGPGADRGWRIALGRAARDALNLPLEVTALALEKRSLAELLELTPDRALIAVLEGPGDGLGVIILSADILAGMTEQLTVGRVNPGPATARKPTRTDAAMVAGTIDAALTELEMALAEEADLVWAGGFRYASFLDDPRPLGLLLDDCPYRLLRAEVTLALGTKKGEILLALPADGRGQRLVNYRGKTKPSEQGPAFSQALAERVSGADCTLVAVVARLSMPLAAVMALVEGQILPLPMAALDRISVEGIDGRRLAEGMLGQNRGMRAIRLIPMTGSGQIGETQGHLARPAPIAAEFDGIAAVPDFGGGMDFAMTGTG